MSGDCDKARIVWRQGNTLVGPSAPLLNLWAQRELRAGGTSARHKARELLQEALVSNPFHGPSLRALAVLDDRSGARDLSDDLYRAAAERLGSMGVPSSEGWIPCTSTAPSSSQLHERPITEVGFREDGDTAPCRPPEEGIVHLLHSRAQQLLRDGNQEAAERVLHQIETLEPNNPHCSHTRGMLALQEGKLDDALAFFNRGLQSRGENLYNAYFVWLGVGVGTSM